MRVQKNINDEMVCKDEIVKFFEDAGYNNVEIIGDRLIFTTGEDVINWDIRDGIKFMKGV